MLGSGVRQRDFVGDVRRELCSGRMLSSPHLMRQLRARELSLSGPANTIVFQKYAYESVVPNMTAFSVQMCPPVLFRRFSADGKYLIGFARNQRDIALYRMEGGGRREDVAEEITREADRSLWQLRVGSRASRVESGSVSTWATTQHDIHQEGTMDANAFSTPPMTDPSRQIPRTPSAPRLQPMPVGSPGQRESTIAVDTGLTARMEAERAFQFSCSFQRFFTKIFEEPVAFGDETLCKEFCLATDDGRFLILASSSSEPTALEQRVGSEEPEPSVVHVPFFDSVTFHLFDLQSKRVSDRFHLEKDFVPLKHHEGAHLFGNSLVILSVRFQRIHVLQIRESGFFSEVSVVGSYCRPDDSLVIAQGVSAEREFRERHPMDLSIRNEQELIEFYRDLEGSTGPSRRPTTTQVGRGMGDGLVHRGFYLGLLHRLLVYVYRKGSRTSFYRNFGHYCSLVMYKVQQLSARHLLIRMGTIEQIARTFPVFDHSKYPCCFVIFDLKTGDVVSFLESRKELESILDVYSRNLSMFWLLPRSTLRAVDPHAQAALRVVNEQSRNRFSQVTFALLRLPVSSQSRCFTPYLNDQLFSFDEKKLGALDGTQFIQCTEYPTIKFTSRRTGVLKFRLTPGASTAGDDPRQNGKKTMSFLFHPTLPFVISTQRGILQSVINFHYRAA